MMKNAWMIAAAVGLFLSNGLLAQKYEADPEKSTIKWTGKKIATEHQGEIGLSNGFLEIRDDKITAGRFEVDMMTIRNNDIDNEARNQRLVDHLKSDDFFSVDQYPTSSLEITGSSGFIDDRTTITGRLTIKGKTEPITFETIRRNNTYSSSLSIDRSKYDVRYGSDSFFDNLGDNAINNIFTLDIKLVMK
jgi:polyisoprenoid-binding protein YceI